jgi:hypothetical protein
MRWVLIWVVLLLGAGLVLGLLSRVLWQKAKALTTEIGAASEGLTAVLASLNDLTEQAPEQEQARTTTRAGAPGDRRDRRGRPH